MHCLNGLVRWKQQPAVEKTMLVRAIRFNQNSEIGGREGLAEGR